jgi:2-polyprenyl-3-methyl-5-hydroxy-6-metoxy-1,4-benzoquinol methylase
MESMKTTPRPSDLDHLHWLNTKVNKNWKGCNVVDLGCGSGYLCEWLKAEGAAEVVGIDIEEPALIGKPLWTFGKVDLEKEWDSDLRSLLNGGSADYIFAFDIIEHLSSPWGFLSSCRKLLKPGGTLVLTTPNINSWERVLRPSNWSGARDPQHKILFAKYSLAFALEKGGYFVETLEAPLRSAKGLAPLLPDIGGQLFSVSKNQ